jgi:hypothetical protein
LPGVNLTTGNNNIDIGNVGAPGEANIIRIGAQVAVTDPFGVLHPAHTATYIAGIRDADATGGDAVFVSNDGKLGTVTVPSAARFKDAIRPMDKASEVILALKPVTFRYKKELNPNGVPQFGLVAEEVEKTAPDLVKRDRNGRLQTVRYDAVNAMLLNEFLKEHRIVEQLKSEMAQQREDFETAVAQQQKTTEALIERLNEQEARIQKVSAEVEVTKSASQMLVRSQ